MSPLAIRFLSPSNASLARRCAVLVSGLLVLTTGAPSAQRAHPLAPPTTLISPQLAPPSEFVALPCGDQVELRWRDNSNETAFVILRRPSNSPHFVELALTGADATSFLDTDVPDGTFVYRVAARKDGLTSRPSSPVSASFPNAPPVITTNLPQNLSQVFSPVLTFTVTVTDPEGDAVSLQLLNPPAGMVFDPVVAEPSPATVRVRWLREQRDELQPTLVFQASCGVQLVRRVRLSHPGYPFDTALLVGDVTGDGELDAVVGARSVGRAYVFAGSTTPSGDPVATLQVAGDVLDGRGAWETYVTVLGDVTGDGRLDVVSASESQKVYVWAGGAGLNGTPAPTAILTPAPFSNYADMNADGPLVQLVDMNGDGTQDIVTVDSQADIGGTTMETGAIYLWLGGAGLSGTQAPSHLLSVPDAGVFDHLGHPGQLVLADATGDGVTDVLAAAATADAGGLDTGAVYLWSGAAVLAGATAPTATLTTPGFPGSVERIFLGDVNGNGTLDIVSGSPYAGVAGVHEVGAFHVWYGGALSGTIPCAATMRISGTFPGFYLGSAFAGLADVTGDGRLDFLALTPEASVFGHNKAGALYVWSGAGLFGMPPPTATLGVPDAENFDRLGTTDPPLQLVKLSGDGILDIVSGSSYGDSAYVWNGGALSGIVAPSATFRAPSPGGEALSLGGIDLADMDGDGSTDLIAGAPLEDVETTDSGGAYVWSGAGGFGAADPPTIRLGHPSGGRLGWRTEFADLDGDGDDDLLLQGQSNSRLFVWRAGPGFFDSDGPDAILAGVNEIGGQGIRFGDWNGDGVLDVVAATAYADPGDVVNAGLVQAWFGGPGLIGTVPAPVTLAVPGARAGDGLASEGIRLADLTGDGWLDVLACSPEVDASASVLNTGALYLWSGSGTLAGTLAPTASFAVPGASSGLRLGRP